MSFESPLASLYPEGANVSTIMDVEVPWTFSSFGEEYAAVRQRCGVMDYSYLGRIAVRGAGAMDFLQGLVAKDIAYLFPERSLTTLLLDEDGTPVDVVVIYKVVGGFVVETSAGRGPACLAHLSAQATDGIEVVDLADTEATVGIEGPFAWEVLGKVIDPQLTGLPYQGVATTTWEGEQVVVSRSGFTGEYGYKLIAEHDVARRLWSRLAEEVTPVGYEVVEVAMTEIRQPILHRELSDDGNVLRCGLNWLVDLEKEEFLGRDALVAQREAVDKLTLGFVADAEVEVNVGAIVMAGGELEIGRVLQSVYSPSLGKRLCLARTDEAWTAGSIDLEVRDAAGELQPVRTVSSPYVIPTSWTVPIL